MAEENTYNALDMALPSAPITTEHLKLAPLNEGHSDGVWSMKSEPECVKFVGEVPMTDRKKCHDEFIDNIKPEGKLKFYRAIEWKAPENHDEKGFIGWVHLKPIHGGRYMEVGYSLVRSVWGKGVATEASKAICLMGETIMKIPTLDMVAHVMVGNDASRKVLEKSGFNMIGEGTLKGINILNFQRTS